MWRSETYTKRLKRHREASKSDIYQYETLPENFRVQVIHIWHTAIGPYHADYFTRTPEKPFSNRSWETIHDSFARELGVFYLGKERHSPFAQCQEYLLQADTNGALDIIEWTFRWIDREVRKLGRYQMNLTGIKQEPDDAIGELNLRFREHGIGYQFAAGEIIRVDSQYVHSEAVKPAIELLRHAAFQGASDEFLKAHEHYRHGRHKEAVSEALKAFESTMKTICDARGWKYSPSATAKTLIDLLIQNDLIPRDLESHFTGLRSALESGLPTIRNRMSGHGQGSHAISMPDYFAAYALHLTASNIVFLVNAYNSLK